MDPDLLGRLVQAVLADEGFGGDCMVDVTLVADRRIREMNHRHRGRDAATDVLALPLQVLEPGVGGPPGRANGPPLHLGDVLVAPGYVSRQAARQGAGFSDEMGLMVVHGVLHLLGYRHDSDAEAEVMGGTGTAPSGG